MSALRQIEIATEGAQDLALISNDDAVWLVVSLRWWDLATWLWWLLCPSDRKAWVRLSLSSGRTFRLRALRVASRHLRVGRMKDTGT